MLTGSEFGDIFDAEHFKATLKDDVRVVNSLPSTHVMFRPLEEKNTPLNASPRWLRAHYAKRVGTLFLRPNVHHLFSFFSSVSSTGTLMESAWKSVSTIGFANPNLFGLTCSQKVNTNSI